MTRLRKPLVASVQVSVSRTLTEQAQQQLAVPPPHLRQRPRDGRSTNLLTRRNNDSSTKARLHNRRESQQDCRAFIFRVTQNLCIQSRRFYNHQCVQQDRIFHLLCSVMTPGNDVGRWREWVEVVFNATLVGSPGEWLKMGELG